MDSINKSVFFCCGIILVIIFCIMAQVVNIYDLIIIYAIAILFYGFLFLLIYLLFDY